MMQPCDDDDELPAFSDALVADASTSALESAPAPTTTTTTTTTTPSASSSSKYAAHQPKSDDSDSDEFHDSESDGAAASFVLVKKSVFKEPKRDGGLLSRLKDARHKYVPTAAAAPETGAAVVAPRLRRATPDAAPQIVIADVDDSERAVVHSDSSAPPLSPPPDEDLGDDGSDITVAIQPTEAAAPLEETDAGDGGDALLVEVDEADGGCVPQVVIHSGESDSDSTGFATLNPVLSATGVSHRYPRSTIALAAAASASSSAASAASAPCLQEIPAMESVAAAGDRQLLLVVNALGASGLAKVEKFGTQSTFLELRLCSVALEPPGAGDELASAVRTALHRKGGRDAQWNQQFSLPLRSTHAQALHLAVRTPGKAVVGEARVSLAALLPGGLFYDQHYAISRGAKSGDGDAAAESGRVHLQLKVVDASATAAAQLPSQQLPSQKRSDAVPAVLRSGALLFKVPFHSIGQSLGAPGIRRQWVAVAPSSAGFEITWGDPTAGDRRSASSLDLALVAEVRAGHRTPAFERQRQVASKSSVVHDQDKCFSLVAASRTLDLVASSREEAAVWVGALRRLLFQASDSECLHSARIMEDYRASALSPRPGASESVEKLLHYDHALSSRSTAAPSKAQLAAWRSAVFDLARRSRTEEIAACLLDGCPIDLLEPGEGDTMLMIACRLGHVQIVELCLSWRAKNDPHPEFGETALQTAVNASHSACVALLLSTAAKSDMDAEIVNHIDSNNDAPLHVAGRHGDLACLELLLHHGADICVVEEFGRTPLHCAVAHGHPECVAYLLDVGGDSVLNAGDHDGDTALHYAALAGNEAIVKLLLESAANVFSANAQNETPYDIALREKHQPCAFLISQYYLTNTKEATTASSSSVPATRNEAASTLLRRQQQQQLRREEEEGDSDGSDEEDASAHEVESGFDTSSAFVSRSPPKHHRSRSQPASRCSTEYRDEEDECTVYDAPLRYGAPSAVALAPATRPVLSPSDEVRMALLRKQPRWTPSEQRYGYQAHEYRPHHESAATSRPAFYYSAREASLSSPYHTPANSFRGAFAERFDRDGDHQYSRQFYEDNAGFYSQARRPTPSSMYTTPSRSRSHSDEMYQYRYPSPDAWRHWEGDQGDSVYYAPSSRRSNSLDMPMRFVRATDDDSARTDWGSDPGSLDTHQSASTPALQDLAASSLLWDTFYTPEGYAYYVHRETGVSQWEDPVAPPPPPSLLPQSHTAQQPREASRDTAQETTLTPDAIIRMRLAEARSQKSSLEFLASPSTPAPPLPLPPDAPPASPAVLASEFQSRKGFVLSIDVSCPPRTDETRPVFVPSPRSRSPPKQNSKQQLYDPLDSPSLGLDCSFQKSRPSSPRGKSKNTQLIELKRANNLAIALASFKISDGYEQVVSDIVAMNEKSVTAELLVCLQRFFPTEDERALLQAFDGPVSRLGKAEQFFHQMLQVPRMLERIDMFLYKLEFPRSHRNVLAKVQVVKRACRNLLENFSFLRVLQEFFDTQKQKRFRVFQEQWHVFQRDFLSQVDEKLRSYRRDLERAMDVELMDVQIQFNRLVSGIRPIRAFVDTCQGSAVVDERDLAAHGALQLFIVETRAAIAEIESEYESMDSWEDKLLGVFGESKATCQLSSILRCVVEIL